MFAARHAQHAAVAGGYDRCNAPCTCSPTARQRERGARAGWYRAVCAAGLTVKQRTAIFLLLPPFVQVDCVVTGMPAGHAHAITWYYTPRRARGAGWPQLLLATAVATSSASSPIV